MVMYGYVWSCIVMHGLAWLCMVMCGHLSCMIMHVHAWSSIFNVRPSIYLLHSNILSYNYNNYNCSTIIKHNVHVGLQIQETVSIS